MPLALGAGGGGHQARSSATRLRAVRRPGSPIGSNIGVADIHACYDLWRSRGARFEVGQSKPEFTYG
ncbi:MAG TPA: hypothetical protein VHW60_00570 [Caulobacteraceae bacterium]|nr:hypothetical protein [Caulobacteraceae bacterium]